MKLLKHLQQVFPTAKFIKTENWEIEDHQIDIPEININIQIGATQKYFCCNIWIDSEPYPMSFRGEERTTQLAVYQDVVVNYLASFGLRDFGEYFRKDGVLILDDSGAICWTSFGIVVEIKGNQFRAHMDCADTGWIDSEDALIYAVAEMQQIYMLGDF